jgi:excisionase family DNA binding protein
MNTAMMQTGECLLTVPQVAERLAISTRKVWRLISQGAIVARKVGQRGTRVPASTIDKYIAGLSDPASR